MPAKSKSQQRLFGMVTAYKDGKLKLDDLPVSLAKKIKSIADGSKRKTGDKRKKTKGITKKAAKDIASTKHKGKPERVSETLKFEDFLKEGKTLNQSPKEIADEVYSILINAQVGDKPVKEKWLKNTLLGFGYDEKSDNGKLFDDVASELVNKGMNIKLEESIDDEIKSTGNIVVKSIEDFTEGVAEVEIDALKGGEAEGKTIEDVADKHDIPVEYLEFILPDAIQIEVEHTDDPEVAARIALDHLWETPLYYDEELGLPEMEEELEEMDDEEIKDVINKVLKYGESEDDDDEEDEKEEDVKEGIDHSKLIEAQSESVEEVANSLFRELKNHRMSDGSGSDNRLHIENENEVELELRHWGRWELDDGDEDEEDNDYEIMSNSSSDAFDEIIKKYKDRYPSFTIYWDTGEKNWVYVTVKKSKVKEGIIIFSDFETVNEDLTKFVGSPGDTEIWYEKATNFDAWDFREEMYQKEADHDMEYTKRYGDRIDPKNLEKTHALLGTIGETDLDEIYHLMNTWGVGELSNNFLKEKGVSHTSMSIGDIIKIGDTVYFVDGHGFKDITNE